VKTSHARRWRGRRVGWSLVALALLVTLAVPAAAQAAGPFGTGPFGITPTPTATGQPRAYFILTLAPGGSARETAIISNQGTKRELLRVTTSQGVTAANSGSAFEGTTGWCAGVSCWIRGLPHVIALSPGARKLVAFRVTVPRWTRPGQYLAGVTVESAIRPRPVVVGRNGRASARAIIIDEVTVGVAVTVGPLRWLRTGLAIPTVWAGWIGPTPRLYIPVRNTGQTFVRATGSVSCRSGGRWRSYRVYMSTVLPAGRAVLSVNAPGLTSGSMPCAIRLNDSAGRLVTWYGTVNLAPQVPTRTYHPSKGVFVSVPVSDSVPPWAVALIVIGSLILTSLVLLLIQSRRRASRPATRPAPRPVGMARRRTIAMTWRPRRS
jgi:hypothetical protein